MISSIFGELALKDCIPMALDDCSRCDDNSKIGLSGYASLIGLIAR